MTRDEILKVLIEALTELQTMSGLEAPNLSAASKPLELEEFDSHKCLELEVLVSERLGFDVKNVLIPKNEPNALLTVTEVVDEILKAAPEQEDLDV